MPKKNKKPKLQRLLQTSQVERRSVLTKTIQKSKLCIYLPTFEYQPNNLATQIVPPLYTTPKREKKEYLVSKKQYPQTPYHHSRASKNLPSWDSYVHTIERIWQEPALQYIRTGTQSHSACHLTNKTPVLPYAKFYFRVPEITLYVRGRAGDGTDGLRGWGGGLMGVTAKGGKRFVGVVGGGRGGWDRRVRKKDMCMFTYMIEL